MRIQTQVKIHEAKGPRLPYPPQEAEVRENELVYASADSILVADGEGILYWVDILVTTDAGSARVYDNNVASGNTLAAGYAAKAPHSLLRNFDPPKYYKHGLFVDVTTAAVEICYKPIARNLRCTVDAFWIPMTLNLVSRVTVRFSDSSRDLVARVTTRVKSTKNLISRVSVVEKTPATRDLVATVDVRQVTSKDLTSKVIVYYTPVDKDLVARVTVRQVSSTALVCHLYADQTE